MEQNNLNEQINILIIGDNGVGKTSILNRFLDDIFVTSTTSTRGIGFAEKNVVFSQKIIKMRIWNTNGENIFKLPVFQMCKNIDGIIITYDVTNANSFNNIDNWINLIKSHSDTNNVQIALVGNKTDISDERVISFVDGKKMSKKHKIDLFFETSALNNIQLNNNTTIQNMFMEFFSKIMSSKNNRDMHLNKNLYLVYICQFMQFAISI
jgi:small GTP-binding protein